MCKTTSTSTSKTLCILFLQTTCYTTLQKAANFLVQDIEGFFKQKKMHTSKITTEDSPLKITNTHSQETEYLHRKLTMQLIALHSHSES